jgi:hypothetical protein
MWSFLAELRAIEANPQINTDKRRWLFQAIEVDIILEKEKV